MSGIANQRLKQSRAADVMAPVRLKDERERGLLAQGWINGAGPFVFVIDTGAGVSLVSRNLAAQARLGTTKSRRTLVGGRSTSPIASNEETRIAGLALGQRHNSVRGSFSAAVVANLPGSIDGILDPTEVFRPYGYSVDIPNRELRVFDA